MVEMGLESRSPSSSQIKKGKVSVGGKKFLRGSTGWSEFMAGYGKVSLPIGGICVLFNFNTLFGEISVYSNKLGTLNCLKHFLSWVIFLLLNKKVSYQYAIAWYC